MTRGEKNAFLIYVIMKGSTCVICRVYAQNKKKEKKRRIKLGFFQYYS